MKHYPKLLVLYCIFFPLWLGCQNLAHLYTKAYKPQLSNPQQLDIFLTLKIKDVSILHGEELVKHCQQRGIPLDAVPQLRIWSAQIIERPNQQNVKLLDCSIAPDLVFRELENNNLIGYWNLTPRLAENSSFILKRHIRFTAYEVAYQIDPTKVGKYNKKSRLYKLYTREEPFLKQTEAIQRLARQIVGNEVNPYFKARLIFDWLLDNMHYYYPPEERTAEFALKKKGGDCGQYAYLFIALCRAVGIPARFVGGFTVSPEKWSYHAWAEFYLPRYGWIPVDPSVAQGYRKKGKDPYKLFGGLPNNRLIASVGSYIPLKNLPDWATSGENSEFQ
ncbi:transglutaminase domain-containing protein, partial [Candidatus Sumerlaeota bacterium]|nr:transglutaminase domain-containing protein [Candidatus Sumerlaeota bacterium]